MKDVISATTWLRCFLEEQHIVHFVCVELLRDGTALGKMSRAILYYLRRIRYNLEPPRLSITRVEHVAISSKPSHANQPYSTIV